MADTNILQLPVAIGNDGSGYVPVVVAGTNYRMQMSLVSAGTPGSAQSANTVQAGPASGSASPPTFRALVLADLPTIPAAGITVGTTVVTGGVDTKVLFDNAGTLGEYAISGTGSVAMTDAPTFVTPTLGIAVATSINKVVITEPASSATLTVADGKSLTANSSLTLTGADNAILTVSHGGTLSGGDAWTLAIGANKTLTALGNVTFSSNFVVSNDLTFVGLDSSTITFPNLSTTVAGLGVANTYTSAIQTVSAATTTSPGWYAQLTGDTFPRVRVGLNATDVASIGFGSGSVARDTFIERVGVGALRFGATDAASPVAQTLSVQSVVAGTSNTAGVNTVIKGSAGTGTGVGGNVAIQVAIAGSTGTTQNTFANAISFSGTDKSSTLSGPANLVAGTTTVAPLVYKSGTNLTTASVGSHEYDGNAEYFTPVSTNRGVLSTVHFLSLSADQTGTDSNSAQTWFPGGGSTTLTLPGSTAYFFDACYEIVDAGTASRALALLFGGTATFTSVKYIALTTEGNNTSSLQATKMTSVAVATAVAVTTNIAAGTNSMVWVKGMFRINAGGTIIPQFQYTGTNPGQAPTIKANSFFRCYAIGINTALNVGQWS